MFGNESEYDLMLEMSGDQLSALVGAVFQLCGWMLYFQACPCGYDGPYCGSTLNGVAWRLYSLCVWFMDSKVGKCRSGGIVYFQKMGVTVSTAGEMLS